MAETVFRMATMEAIKQIVEDHSVSGRFGLIVTEESMAEISKKVVDLFEMTLELRSKTAEIFGDQMPPQQNKKQSKNSSYYNNDEENSKPPFPKSRNAAEIYSFQENKREQNNLGTELIPNLNAKLPRQKFELSLEEKERFSRRF